MLERGALDYEIDLPESIRPELKDSWIQYSPDFNLLREELAKQGIEVQGGRKLLSAGSMGPLFVLETSKGKFVEKNFLRGGASKLWEASWGKGLARVPVMERGSQGETKHRLGIVNDEGEVDQVVIDWAYNEEMALSRLEGIEGIPALKAVVRDGLKTSVIEQYIEGEDLSIWLSNSGHTIDEVRVVMDKVRNTYTEAAKRGILYNYPIGSTIMIESSSGTPYLIDWYNYSEGSLDEPAVKQKYEAGLRSIDETEKDYLAAL